MNYHNEMILIDSLTEEITKSICEYIEKEFKHHENKENFIQNFNSLNYIGDKIVKPLVELYFRENL